MTASIFPSQYYQTLFHYQTLNPSLSKNTSSFIPEYKEEKSKGWFSFKKNENLLEINKKLEELFQSTNSNTWQNLQKELHGVGMTGVEKLTFNLHTLNTEFENENKMGFFKRLILRIINFIRPLFGFEKIQPPQLKIIDLENLSACVNRALLLTEQEKEELKISLQFVQGQDSLKTELNENILKELVYGLRNLLEFHVGQNHFRLEYSKKTKQFKLSYLGIIKEKVTKTQDDENYKLITTTEEVNGYIHTGVHQKVTIKAGMQKFPLWHKALSSENKKTKEISYRSLFNDLDLSYNTLYTIPAGPEQPPLQFSILQIS